METHLRTELGLQALNLALWQRRGERSAQPARVSAAQVHYQNRLVDSLGTALIARNDPAAAGHLFSHLRDLKSKR